MLRNWKSGALALAALVLGLSAAGITHAQQPATLPMQVTENRAPGAAGQVTMTPMGNNQVRVDIRITGLPANQERAAHIHTPGQCDVNAPVTYPLSNVRVDGSGVGTSSTTISVTEDKPVQANNAYVNVHANNVAQAGAQPGQGVICANITASFAAGAAGQAGGQAGGQGAAAMPRTGTGLVADTPLQGGMLAGLAAMAVLVGSIGMLARARRR